MMFWIAFIPAWGLGMLGALLLGRGFAGLPLRGRAPHCRRCNFDLTGLWEVGRKNTPGTDRCPECGSLLHTDGAIVIGRLQRRPRKMIVGSLCLLCAIALFIIPAAQSRINWISLKPTSMLIQQSRSVDIWRAGEAADELARRQAAGDLSDARLAEILDIYLSHAEAGDQPTNRDAWSLLAADAFDQNLATNEHRERYLKAILSDFTHTQQRLRDIYLANEFFPFDEDAIVMYPRPSAWGWLIPERVVGMAAYLQEATLDSQPLELAETSHGKEWDGPREGWSARWTSYGTPRGNRSSSALFPESVHEIARITPPVGVHELTLRWRIDAFLLAPKEVGRVHPYRDADATWEVEMTHAFEVIGSVEEVLTVIRSDGPNAQPPPRYLGADQGLILQVIEARKLRRDGNWYYRIRAKLTRAAPSPDATYALLARVHLEIEGVRYEVAELGGTTDVFYDGTTAEPLDQSTPDLIRTFSTLNIIDLPRVESADIVLTPAPELILKYPGYYIARAYWGEPVIIRNVPLDWSGIPEPDAETDPPTTAPSDD